MFKFFNAKHKPPAAVSSLIRGMLTGLRAQGKFQKSNGAH